MSQWIWRCSVKGCFGQGKKPLIHSRARFHGKLHGKRVHGNRKLEPIIEKVI